MTDTPEKKRPIPLPKFNQPNDAMRRNRVASARKAAVYSKADNLLRKFSWETEPEA